MNGLKEADILDKSKLTLNSLFRNEIVFTDKLLFDQNSLIDGLLSINSVKFGFVVLKKPTKGKIISIVNKLNQIAAEIDRSNSSSFIFIIDYASEDIIQLLKNYNLNFVDTAGNCFINLPNLKVFVEGKNNVFGAKKENKIAFQKTGLKLVFQLLTFPEILNLSFREIEKISEISLASISNIFDELSSDGFLLTVSGNRKILVNVKRLITKWANAYLEILRPKIHRGYYRFLDEMTNIEFENLLNELMKNTNFYLGGEFASFFLNGAIKPKKLTFYTNIRISEIAKKYKIVPVSKNVDNINFIEILEIFWNDNEILKANNGLRSYKMEAEIVDPILIYTDLLNSSNYRSVETAEEILENEIRHRYVQNKFQW